MILTYKYRIKDSTVGKRLDRHSRACNFVGNYCCQIQREAQSRWVAGRAVRWPSAFDLIKLCTGAAADLGLHSDTVQTICRQFAASRDARHKCPRFRASFGPKRASGWIPFIPRAVKVDGTNVVYLTRKFHFWKSRDLGGEFKAGCFTQDARGRWYAAFQCDVADDLPTGNGEIGVDLGLKHLATCSDGRKFPALRHYREYEERLAVQQRAGNKRRVRAIHARIANARKDNLHRISSMLAADNSLIVVGDVNASKLAKTRLAKSVSDAGWSMFRSMLAYKSARHGAVYIEADERWTSRTCSRCGAIPDSSPKGMSALGVRHFECSDCGATHDRDVNAALNILRVGRERSPPAVEIPAL